VSDRVSCSNFFEAEGSVSPAAVSSSWLGWSSSMAMTGDGVAVADAGTWREVDGEVITVACMSDGQLFHRWRFLLSKVDLRCSSSCDRDCDNQRPGFSGSSGRFWKHVMKNYFS
jgi:hypothetical protein